MSITWWPWQTALLDPCPGISSQPWQLYHPLLDARSFGASCSPFSHHMPLVHQSSVISHLKVLLNTCTTYKRPHTKGAACCKASYHNSHELGLCQLCLLSLVQLGLGHLCLWLVPLSHFWVEILVCFGLSSPLIKALLKKRTEFFYFFILFLFFYFIFILFLFFYFIFYFLFFIFFIFQACSGSNSVTPIACQVCQCG